MRTILLVTLAWALAVAAPACAQSASETAKPTSTAYVTFLHFNDAYQISPRRGLGGMGPLATLIKRERERSRDAILTFGGDLISPSLLASLTKGAHMIEIANLLRVDVAVLGNHEFDHGPDVLRARIAESKFPWLGANVTGLDGRPFGGTAATWIRKVGPLTVGIFGLLTPHAREYIRGDPPVVFQPYLPQAERAMAALKAQGAEIFVALTHMSLAEDQDLARRLPGLHLILGGHEHIPITIYERGVLILKAGVDAEFLGVVELAVTRAGGELTVVPGWRLAPVLGIQADPEVQARVRHYEGELAREFGERIGRTETPLDSRASVLRQREAAIGSLVADAMRAGMDADVALQNGGGIRGNKRYPAGAPLTRRDVLTELPFNNTVVLLEASGADIRAALEHGLSRAREPSGAFPQVSGIRLVFDASRPAGQRILSLELAGAPADAARSYKLAVTDFLAQGGDGYSGLQGLKRLIDAQGGPGITNLVIDHIRRVGSVAPRDDERVVEKP